MNHSRIAPRSYPRKQAVIVTIILTLGSSLISKAQTCELYPIALSAQSLSNAVPGTVLTNIYNGTRPGNFCWLSWSGNPSESTLGTSLTPSGASSSYVNPDNTSDHQLVVGDWVSSKPGVSHSKNVRNALNNLETMNITVPVWNQSRGHGASAACRVSAFAIVRIVSYQLSGQNRITARFLGYTECGVSNEPSVVKAGPVQTNTLPASASQTCELYPIALSAQTLSNAVPGNVLTNISNGTQPGNFGWLSWSGSASDSTFVTSLTPPGDSSTYVNPDNPNDHQLVVGDWVSSKQNVSNSKNIRDALNNLETTNITIPVWNQSRGQTNPPAYRVSAFAIVHILSYQLPGQNQLTVQFLGYANCGVTNEPPVVNAGPDQTILWPSNQITLKGVATDNGLPNGTLTVTWSEASGPGTVTFANPASTNTTATFSVPGLYVLSLSASDGSASSSASTTITVDQAPTVTLPTQFLINWPSNQLTLSGTVSDDGLPVGAVLNQVWSQSNGPGTISFSPAVRTNLLAGTAITNAVSTTATVSAPGLYKVQLTADDGVGTNRASATVVINQPPTVSAGSNQVVTFPQAALLNGTATDDGLPFGTLSITWSQVSGAGTVTFANPNSAATTASFSASGVYVLKLTASDGAASSSATVTIIADKPPVVSAGPNQLITWPGNQVSLAGSVIDDGLPSGTLTTTWTSISGPGTVTFGNPAVTNTTATFSAPGVYVLQLTASDGAASTTAQVTITLNQPPNVGAGPNQTILWPSNQVTLNGAATDDGLPSGTLTVAWTKVSGPGTVTFGNAAVTNTTATFSAPGVYVLQLSASDGAASKTAQVTIILNQPPNVSAGPDQTILWPSNRVALNGVATDDGLPNGTLTLTWSKASGPGTVTFGNPAVTNTTATFSAPGVYVLQLTASDGATSATAQVTITLNQPPNVGAGPNQTILWPSNQVALNGVATDDGLPNGILTATWSEASGPGTVTFANPASTNTTATFSAPGLYVLSLSASDGSASSSASTTIIVDYAPTVTLPPQFIINWPSNQLTLSGTVSDDGFPVGAVLNQVWMQSNGPGTISFSPAVQTNVLAGTAITNSASTTATVSAPGLYNVQLTADDGVGTNEAVATVIVNQAPTVSAGSNQVVTFPQAALLNGTATDDGLPSGTLSITWSQVSGPGTVTFANPNSAATAASFSASGVYVLKLIASDGAASSSATVTITANQPPVVSAGPNQLITWPGNQVSLAGSATDDGLPSGTLTTTWASISGPGTVTFGNPAVTNTTATFSAPGVYVLQLTANDGATSTTAQVTIILNQPPNVSAGANQIILWPSNQVTLNGVATDDGLPNGTLTVTWSETSGPGTVTFANPATTNTTATFSAPGLYVLSLSASDGSASSSASVTITVDQAPTVTLPTQFIINWPSNQLTLSGMVTDDGLPVGAVLNQVWSQSNGPGTISFSATVQTNILAGTAITNAVSTTAIVSAPGLYNIQLTADDGVGTNRASATVVVNQAPTVSAGSNQVVTFPQAAFLNGTVTDDGLPYGTLSIIWSQVSGPGTVTFANPNSAATGASFSASGVYVLQLTASDGAASTSDTVTITANKPPVVSAGPNQIITWPGNQVSLAGSAADDGLPSGTLTITWTSVSGPGTVTFGNSAATNTTATFSAPGVYVLQLTANDGATSTTAQVTIVLNQPPNVSAGPNQTILWPSNQITLNGVATDDGLPSGTLTVAWSEASGPGTVTFGNPATTDTTATFSASGLYVLSLSASDGSASSSASTTITVDQAPTVTLPAQFVINWPSNQLTLSGTVTDDGLPVGAVLNQVWSQHNGPGTISFSAAVQTNILAGTVITNAISTTATVSAPGLYSIQLTADDGVGTNEAVATVIVNQAPTVSAGSNQVVTFPQAALLNGTATDDGLPIGQLTYSWIQISGPGVATFANPSTNSTSVSFSAPGVYVLQFSANDSLATGSDQVTIRANIAPVAQSQSVTVVEDSSTNIILQASDVDGDPLSFAIVTEPQNGTLSQVSPNQYLYTPAPTYFGSDSFSFKANDGYVDSAAAIVTLTVLFRNHPPTFTAGPNQAVVENAGPQTVTGWASNISPGPANESSQKVHFLVSSDNPGLFSAGPAIASNGTLTYTAATNTNGVATITVQAQDDGGTNNGGVDTSVPQTFTITVIAPPVLSVPGPQTTADAVPLIFGANRLISISDATVGQAAMQLSVTVSNGAVTFGSTNGLTFLSGTNGSSFAVITGTNGSSSIVVTGTLADLNASLSNLTYTSVLHLSGSDTLSLLVSDLGNNALGTPLTDSNSVSISIYRTNHPYVSAGPDRAFSGTNTITLNGVVVDGGIPTNAPFVINWSRIYGPGNVTFGDSNSPITTATFSTNGIYVLQLFGSDALGSSSNVVTVRANEVCTVEPPSGLVAWWPGNLTAQDEVTGAMGMAGNVTFATGMVGPAFSFNGSTSFIDAPAQSGYNVGANGLTIEFWIHPNNFQVGSLLGWSHGVRAERFTTTSAGDSLRFYLTGTNAGQYVSSPMLWAGTNWAWTHVAMSYDATSGMAAVYTNGILTVTSFVGTNLLSTAGDFYLGQVPGSANFYAGLLDEVTLYSRPLNGEEIYNIFAAGNVGKCPHDGHLPPVVYAGPDLFVTGVPGVATLAGQVTDTNGLPIDSTIHIQWSEFSGPGTVTFANAASATTTATFSTNGVYVLQLTADNGEAQSSDLVEVRVEALCSSTDLGGLVAWWPANGSIVDVVNGYGDALLYNGTGYTNGEVAAAFNFNGFDNYVWMPAHGNYDLGRSANGFTVEFWMSENSFVNSGVLGWANGVRIERVYGGSANGDSLRCYVAGTNANQFVTSSRVWPSSTQWNQWYHLAVTYDRTTGLARIYTNGILNATANVGTNVMSTAGDFYLAQVPGSPGDFSGKLDEVSLYSRPLNAEEVYSLFSSGSTGKCPNENNQPPVVSAGPDLFVTGSPGVAALNGQATDDGLPVGSTLQTGWSVVSGPGAVTFANSSSPATSATFNTNGVYVLQLTANDGEYQVSDFVEVRVDSVCIAQDPAGLAAWWPANNNSTDVINGQNAVLVNGTGYTAGKVANAFQFDGVVDYIIAFASSNYDVGTSTNGFTLEFWIKAAVSGSPRAVLSWNNSNSGGTSNGISLYESGSAALWTMVDTAGGQHALNGSTGVQNVFNGNWRHLALTYNRSTGVAEVYVDGVLQLVQNVGTFQPQTSYDLVFGQVLTIGQLFLGQLDEISLYRRPLTQQEVLNIYQSGSIGKCPENANQPPTVYAGPDLSLASTNVVAQLNGVAFDNSLPPGGVLLSQWTMLDGPGVVTFANSNSPTTTATFSTNGIYTLQLSANNGEEQSADLVQVRVGTPCGVSDISGLTAWWPANGNPIDKLTGVPATLINGATYAPGKVGGSFQVNGTNDYVFAAAQPNYDVGSSSNGFTLEFWEKAAFSSPQRGVLGWNSFTSGGNANGVYMLQASGNSASINLVDSTGASHQLANAANAFNGNWRHLALTYDRVAGQAKVYLDGTLVVNQAVGSFQPQTVMDLNFGRVPNGGSSFIGQFDEVSLYTRPLAQSEIQSIVSAGAAGKCVTPSNMPPVLTAGPNQTISFPTNTATLNGIVTDDGLPSNTLSIAWTYIAGNSTVFFSSTNTPVTTVTFTNIGTYMFQLSASDGQNSTNATTTVTVLPDQ